MITATGEVNAARALKEAAESIGSSPTAMQLRYLQTLNIIAAERGSTIIFPIPIDMMGPMVRGMCNPLSCFVFSVKCSVCVVNNACEPSEIYLLACFTFYHTQLKKPSLICTQEAKLNISETLQACLVCCL